VKWLFEEQGQNSCIIVSPSKPIPLKGSEADEDALPPHRQAAAHHKRVVKSKGGDFKVTMETPTEEKPKPFRVDITAYGASIVLAVVTAIGTATSTSARAG
jgi:hypothetical protein